MHQGDILKEFKEKNLTKVSFLKLLTKENLFGGYFKHRNYAKKITQKQRGFFDH